MAANIELGSVQSFDCRGDVTSVSPRWKRWKKSFQFFVEGKGVTNVKQKKALLLHCAGVDVQEIFETLPTAEVGEDTNEYEVTLKMLDEHFSPKANIPYERHIFRQMRQEDGESVDQFVIRLKHQAENCNFGDQQTEQIRDQVIDKCRASGLRRKLLERGQDLKLEDVQRIARSMEAAEIQSKKMEESKDGVNHLRRKPKNVSGNENTKGKTCFRCGREGHYARDSSCPARSATCNKCHKTGHFAAVCKTRSESKKSTRGNPKRDNSWKGVSKSINSVDDDDEYAFHIKSGALTELGLIDVNIGGVELGNVMIDSGSSCNIIDKKTWEVLKKKGVKCKSEKLSDNIYPYGTVTPLKTLGKFHTKVSVAGNVTEAEFIVLDGSGRSILGCSTAKELKVLKLGYELNALTDSEMKQKYPECFKGIGKLKDFQLKIHINPAVNPVAQSPRRIPFSQRKKVEDKLDELLEKDIIEKVEGPTPWVSPVCIVPKPTGDIRLCVDMRRANEAIQRERHPIPTVDEVLLNMNQSTVFSKIDLKWGFHQIELEEESRSVTTFTTHCGLFRYKRLMFGITSADGNHRNHRITRISCRGEKLSGTC